MKKLIQSIFVSSLLLTGFSVQAGVVVVVGADSQAASTNEADIIKVFLGKKKDLGGVQMVPIDQSLGEASRSSFYTKVVNKSDAQLKSYWSRLIFTGKGQAPQIIGNDSDVKSMVASNPNLIGYIDESSVDSSVKVIYKQ